PSGGAGPGEEGPAGEAGPTTDASASAAGPDSALTPKQRARRGFERGVEAAQAGDFLEAASAFEDSYAAIPAANTLFNVGWAYEHAERWVAAVEVYRRYLSEYGGA